MPFAQRVQASGLSRLGARFVPASARACCCSSVGGGFVTGAGTGFAAVPFPAPRPEPGRLPSGAGPVGMQTRMAAAGSEPVQTLQKTEENAEAMLVLRGLVLSRRWRETFAKMTESLASDRRLDWEWKSPTKMAPTLPGGILPEMAQTSPCQIQIPSSGHKIKRYGAASRLRGSIGLLGVSNRQLGQLEALPRLPDGGRKSASVRLLGAGGDTPAAAPAGRLVRGRAGGGTFGR